MLTFCDCVRPEPRQESDESRHWCYRCGLYIQPKIPSMLMFSHLRDANIERLPLFKNSKGLPAHSQADGSDWSISDWIESVTGELGELANWHKKYRRGDITEREWLSHAAKEIADVAIYLDILAYQMRLDLGAIIAEKFNEVSDRVGCPHIKL